MDGLKKDLSTTEPLATLLFYFFNSTCPCRGMARACPRLLLCMSLAQRQPMTSGKLRLVESVSFANINFCTQTDKEDKPFCLNGT